MKRSSAARTRYSFNVHPVVKDLLLRHRWLQESNDETYNRIFTRAIGLLEQGDQPPTLTFTYALELVDVRCDLRLLAQYHAFDLMGDGSEVEVTVRGEKHLMRDMKDPGPWAALISFRAAPPVEAFLHDRITETYRVREALMPAVKMAACMPVQPQLESADEAYRLLSEALPLNTELPIGEAISALDGKTSSKHMQQMFIQLKQQGKLRLGMPAKGWRSTYIDGKSYRSIEIKPAE
jgi:hypothetical protein